MSTIEGHYRTTWDAGGVTKQMIHPSEDAAMDYAQTLLRGDPKIKEVMLYKSVGAIRPKTLEVEFVPAVAPEMHKQLTPLPEPTDMTSNQKQANDFYRSVINNMTAEEAFDFSRTYAEHVKKNGEFR